MLLVGLWVPFYNEDGTWDKVGVDFDVVTPEEYAQLPDPLGGGGWEVLDSPHDKGRDCARTEEVLENYRTRAIRAELALRRQEGFTVEDREEEL